MCNDLKSVVFMYIYNLFIFRILTIHSEKIVIDCLNICIGTYTIRPLMSRHLQNIILLIGYNMSSKFRIYIHRDTAIFLS